MNKELLLKVKQAILDNPDHFDMQYWFMKNGDIAKVCDDLTQCGTTACIAGWTLYLVGEGSTTFKDTFDLQSRALELLDLKIKDKGLFHTLDWPREFFDQYEEAKANNDCEGMAQAAADMIDHFMENGE